MIENTKGIIWLNIKTNVKTGKLHIYVQILFSKKTQIFVGNFPKFRFKTAPRSVFLVRKKLNPQCQI